MEEGKQSLPNEISAVLIRWYETHRRELPWRETTDPYRIWISEIILQQTRVAQGLEYYLRFVERFPDVRSLAGAHEDEVMKLWQGLGYYSRARNLQKAARQIMDEHGGVFPTDYPAIRALAGIGDYTAAAIASYLSSGAIKGIGPKTAAALVTSIDISAFRGHDELASYCGVAPSDRRSGSSIRSTSPQHGGNRQLKNLLIFSCNSLISTDNRFGRYYGECRARGMRHGKALKAVARKRLKVIYAIMRDAVPYAA